MLDGNTAGCSRARRHASTTWIAIALLRASAPRRWVLLSRRMGPIAGLRYFARASTPIRHMDRGDGGDEEADEHHQLAAATHQAVEIELASYL